MCITASKRYTFLMLTNTAIVRLILLALALPFVAGCSTAPAVIESPLPIAAEDYRKTFEVAVASLRDHGFVIDRQDYRFGRITTKPRVSPNMLEIWNQDNTTAAQSVSASLNNEHRIVAIELNRAAGSEGQPAASAYALTVEVSIERTTDPDRRLTGSTSPTNMVRPLKETPAQFQREGVQGTAMVFVARDEHFEQRLLADISQRLSQNVIVE